MPSVRTNHLLQHRGAASPAEAARRRVLVVEDRPFAADGAAAELQRHEEVMVSWCRDARGEVSCDGVVNDECPLQHSVDLVLDFRSDPSERLTAGEVGVACAGVEGVPVVVAGPARPDQSDAPWAVAACTTEDAAGFCRQLLASPEAFEDRQLEDLVRRVLRMRGEEVGEVVVDVLRWPGATSVVVRSDVLPSATSCADVDRALRGRHALDGGELGVSFTAGAE